MKYENFEFLINTLLKRRDDSFNLYKLGVDISNYEDDLYRVIDLLMERAFGSSNKEWIDWFVYERVTLNGEILEAWDENKNPICYDIKSLWEEITK